MKPSAYVVLEGGGAKGLAHVGALRAIEPDYDVAGYGGSSAGAVVASLSAAGYTPDELFSADGTASVIPGTFADLIGVGEWERVDSFVRAASKLLEEGKTVLPRAFEDVNRPRRVLRSMRARLSLLGRSKRNLSKQAQAFYEEHHDLIHRALDRKGLLATSEFEKWLDGKLAEKLRGNDSGAEGPVLFGELQCPLKIVTTDINNGRAVVYSRLQSPDESVAAAVAASIAIPFLFEPRTIRGVAHVDGGLVSNFPAWTFDVERASEAEPPPIFGFRLIDEAGKPAKAIASPAGFVQQVFLAGVFGDNSLETRLIDSLAEIPIEVGLGTTEFTAGIGRQKEAYKAGYSATKMFLESYRGPVAREKAERLLKGVEHEVRKQFPEELRQCHLRLNVMRKVSANFLQVVHSVGMDDDYDDRLRLPIGAGAAGSAYVTGKPRTCDMVAAADCHDEVWGIDRYCQRLIRESLISLLSVPIFDTGEEVATPGETPVYGVLSIDSDTIPLDVLQHPAVVKAAEDGALFLFDCFSKR